MIACRLYAVYRTVMDGFLDRTWTFAFIRLINYLACWSSTVGFDSIHALLDIVPDYTWALAL